jgi:hypothetical protein
MTRGQKWLVSLGAGFSIIVLLGAFLFSRIPSDEELANLVATRLETSLGVPLSVGSIHWRLLPVPVVVIENATTLQAQPIVIKKLTAAFNVASFWQRHLKVDHIDLDGAVLPQMSLHDLGAKHVEAGVVGSGVELLTLSHLYFHDVTWISRYGNKVLFDGEVNFDQDWRPRSVHLQRPGFEPPTEITLARLGHDDKWDININMGGGTANGQIQLQTSDKGGMRLTGKLQPSGIEVASSLEAFNIRPIIEGKASGETTLSAVGNTVAEIAQSLHSTTRFTMGASTLLRFDLNKAIRSVGQDHAGTTALDSVRGQMETQNTPDGMVFEFTDMKASSQVLSASGKARVANRHIDAECTVDLVEGLVGVPLKVSGPLGHVQVFVPKGALAGAVVGTAILPGIGTAIGARIGATLGTLFGKKPASEKDLPPPAAKPH